MLLRTEFDDCIEFVKKNSIGNIWVEGHSQEKAANHNINVPMYYLPLCDEFLPIEAIKERFANAGKEFRE